MSNAEVAPVPITQDVQAGFVESIADWDPLQGGYQAIIDICEEARSRIAAWERQPNFYEPERTGPSDQAGGTDNVRHVGHFFADAMPPPRRFRRICKKSFVG